MVTLIPTHKHLSQGKVTTVMNSPEDLSLIYLDLHYLGRLSEKPPPTKSNEILVIHASFNKSDWMLLEERDQNLHNVWQKSEYDLVFI